MIAATGSSIWSHRKLGEVGRGLLGALGGSVLLKTPYLWTWSLESRDSESLLVSIQSFSRVRLFVTPWTAARQASLSITSSRNLLKLMSIKSVMPSYHLILCRPPLLLSIFPSIRVFSDESVLCIRWQRIAASATATVLPMNIFLPKEPS